jgi:hypothetical protein
MTLLASWGNLPDAERRARYRALQALAQGLAGPSANELVNALCAAGADLTVLARCDAALDALATVPRRRILATFLETLPVRAR